MLRQARGFLSHCPHVVWLLTSILKFVAHVKAPASERPCLSFNDISGTEHGQTKAVALHPLSFDDTSISIDERNVDCESHSDCVHPVAGFDDERTFERSLAEQPLTAGSLIVGDLG